MRAMEDQIASLAGLVHHALSIGPDVPGVKGPVRSVTLSVVQKVYRQQEERKSVSNVLGLYLTLLRMLLHSELVGDKIKQD